MAKKILHFQIPLEPNKLNKDALAISPQLIAQFMTLIENKLDKDEWVVIVSPFIPSVCEEDVFHNFDMKQFNKDELLNLIKEK